MPPISMKKVLIAILIIVLLSRLDRIFALFSGFYQAIYDSFEPLRNSSIESRYIAALAFLALIWVTVYLLLQNRK